MKSIRILFLILVFSFVSFAQTKENQIKNNGKIAVIYSERFADEKAGIDEFIKARKLLESEFNPQEIELKAMFDKVEKLLNEINELTKVYEPNTQNVERKINEYETSACKMKSKVEEVRNLFNERESEIFKEVNDKIYKALKKFTEEKGYAIVLDGKKNKSAIIGAEPVDITKEFIEFYDENFSNMKSQ